MDFLVTTNGVEHPPVTLLPAHNGDLAQACEGAFALPWGAPITVKPVAPPGKMTDFQFACVEAGTGVQNQFDVAPNQRHLLLANLRDFYAAQCVPGDLKWYSRGNLVIPLVNGKEYFKDIFQELNASRGPGAGFHLAGWHIDPGTLFIDEAPAGAPSDNFRRLNEVVKHVDSRFLGVRFIQPENLQALTAIPCLVLLLGFGVVSLFNYLGVERFRSDASGLIVLVGSVVGGGIAAAVLAGKNLDNLEPNSGAKDALGAGEAKGKFLYSYYPATYADRSPYEQTSLPQVVLDIAKHFDVYHLKIAMVKTVAGQYIGYCGGIDFNADRLDDANHLSLSPLHDVQVRIEGPAVRDLALTFDECWQRERADPRQGLTGPLPEPVFAPPSEAALDQPGKTIVQVARTFFKPADPARQLPFAPTGDHTLLDTLVQAIAAAQRFIYIEDQYLTPPLHEDYWEALVSKVKEKKIRKLIIAIPGATDQLFGELLRGQFIQALYDAQGTGEDIVTVGCPRRRYTTPRCDLRASSGKLLLAHNMGINDPAISLSPALRAPSAPFWIAVDGELMYAYQDTLSAPGTASVKEFDVYRGNATHLVNGLAGKEKGTFARTHFEGTPATVVELANIYVHAKVMIVDDVFASIGSANINRRGHYSDGECNIFAVPESLRAHPANPVLALRKRLWAEMLDLPETIAAPLLEDALAAAPLFGRSWLLGNRYVPYHAYPSKLLDVTKISATFNPKPDSIFDLLKAAGMAVFQADYDAIFNNLVDPSNLLEPQPKP